LAALMMRHDWGMANACGARALERLGLGDLRSFAVLLCLGISAYITLMGVLSPPRTSLASSTAITPVDLTFPAVSPRSLATRCLRAALLAFALRSRAAGHRASDLIGGALIGLLIVAGWWVTGSLGNDVFDPVPVVSLTCVAPIGDTIQYAM